MTRVNPQDEPRAWAVLAAAGSGSRFGAAVPKQLVPLGGRSLLVRSLEALLRSGAVEGVVVALPAGELERRGGLPESLAGRGEVILVAGGATRCASVRAGLAGLPAACNLVLVHDAARPAVSADLIRRVAEGAWRHGACIPGVPAVDTVKEVDPEDRIVRTLDRGALRMAQTPQGFRRAVIEDAYRHLDQREADPTPTDDASLVERAGHPVTVIDGEPDNLKVTAPDDLRRLGLAVPRVGFGYDVHRFAPGRRLVLCGVEIPAEVGLLGHSDADVALHAVCDAVLGAAGLGDIGRLFADDDPAYRDACSLDLLREVCERARRAGFRMCSADVTIVAQQPRLAPHMESMCERLAGALGIDPAAAAVKATTEEGLGFTGRKEGVAAYAVVVLEPSAGG